MKDQTPSANAHDYWCISLEGSEDDLESLVKISDVDWKLELDADTYYLIASAFQSCPTASEVWSMAGVLVADVELAARITFPYFKGVRPDKVFEVFRSGERRGHAFVSAEFGFTVGMRASPSGGRIPYKEVFETIQADPAAKEAAHYFALVDRGWTFFLWKTYEIIREDVATATGICRRKALGPVGLNWVSDEKFERFETAIHNPKASGDDARHARPRKKEAHPNPMRRSEAISFVRSLLLKWTRWKHAAQTMQGL